MRLPWILFILNFNFVSNMGHFPQSLMCMSHFPSDHNYTFIWINLRELFRWIFMVRLFLFIIRIQMLKNIFFLMVLFVLLAGQFVVLRLVAYFRIWENRNYFCFTFRFLFILLIVVILQVLFLDAIFS